MADDYPTLDGKVHPTVASAIRQAFQGIYSLRNKINAIPAADPNTPSLQKQLVTLQQNLQTVPGSSFFQNGDSSALKALGQGQASVLPTGANAITFANTGNSITWTWTGLTLLWPNQEKDVIPDGSLAVTGLALSTAYTFYIYVDMVTLSVKFASTPGGVGSPAVAYTPGPSTALASQFAYGDNHVPISLTGLAASTTGGGVGPGGSGGGRKGWGGLSA